jgi:uncharacterized protein YjbJ (UPF0337 family)
MKGDFLMNSDILEGNWKQIRGRIKSTWGRLTDDELDEINGHMDQLIGKLQVRYGYTRMNAEQQVREFVDRLEKEFPEQERR